jgi:two-component system sensor histidine kinase BaeS
VEDECKLPRAFRFLPERARALVPSMRIRGAGGARRLSRAAGAGPGSRPMASRGQGPIGLRLALAFVAIAVLAVTLVALLAVVFSQRDISVLLQQRRDDLAQTLSIDAVSTYNTGRPGWFDVDLKPALELAASSGTAVAILDQDGNVVASNLADPEQASGVERRPLTLNGQPIGTLLVKFSGRGLAASADNLRASLARAVIGAAVLAAVLALLAALLVSRRITRPVTRLIESVRARSRGNRTARVGPVPSAPAELRELAATFDQMADIVDAQEQLRRNLVADVAHELRTPVAVLQANTEALLDGIVPHTPEQTAALHQGVLRLGRLVDDLQTLAAAEAAALQLSLQPCDLALIARAAADDWEASFTAAGVSFEPQLEPAPVDADPGRLHQVITNLLSNALKFTPPGGRVQMILTRASGHARLEVADTGPGIPPEDQPHVFERFWRAAQAGQTPGSGIGLAVAAELARAQQGSIEVTSETGHGTRFTLILPLASEITA